MSARAIRCPNCGGDLDLDARVCPYCNSDIVCNEYEQEKKAIVEVLIAAKNELSSGKYQECRSHINQALSMDTDCADAWYMSAVLKGYDQIRYEQEIERAASCSRRYGIFGESDVEVYRKISQKWKKNMVMAPFLFVGFIIFFIGGALSLGLGIGFETLVPLYITLAILAVWLIISIIVIRVFYKKK